MTTIDETLYRRLVEWAADESNIGFEADSYDCQQGQWCIFCEHWLSDDHDPACLHLAAKAARDGGEGYVEISSTKDTTTSTT